MLTDCSAVAFRIRLTMYNTAESARIGNTHINPLISADLQLFLYSKSSFFRFIIHTITKTEGIMLNKKNKTDNHII